ncbi:MAG: carboxypeptidase regulatory-like domain-containing protein [Rhodothermales bacterium]|nr:carboxypeptidase regulatory-like domain-containing protein [Rhodothermales bacterium]
MTRTALLPVVLVFWLNLSVIPGEAFGQVAGVVQSDGEPVSGALVFVSGTTASTESAEDGSFELPGSGLAWFDVAAWHPDAGFGFAQFEPGVTESVSISLEDVYAAADSDRAESDVDLDYFRDVAFAWTGASGKVEIENPDALIVRRGAEEGVVSAAATAPVRLSNPELGYEIEIHAFRLDGSPIAMEWSGYPLFSEMTPERDRDARNWDRARSRTFEGSRRHFLHALAIGRLEQEEFEAFHVQGPGSASELNPVAEMGETGFGMGEIDPVMRDGQTDATRQLMFQGWLYVNYYGRGENRYTRYVDRYFPSSDLKELVMTVNRSWIRLPYGVVTIDTKGTVLPDPSSGGIQTFGYWTFKRLADLLPYDYLPED